MPETPTLTQTAAEVVPMANGPAAMAARRYRLAGDVVNQATKDLPDDQKHDLRWLHLYGHDNDVSTEELASLIKKPDGTPYSENSIYQALSGRRTASGVSLEPLCKAIAEFRRIVEIQGAVARSPFVETNLTKRVFKVCESARIFQRIVFVIGDSQIGKTTALEEFQRRDKPGQCVYVRMPTRGNLGDFLRWTAVALQISPQQKNEWHLKERIFKAFDRAMVFIVDEAHQPLIFSWGHGGAAVLEFIREIHDRCRCGIVLAGTKVFSELMEKGVQKELLRQLGLRRLFSYLMPPQPTRANLDLFAASLHLRPATGEALELQTNIIKADGLGRWSAILQGASRLAHKTGKKLDWSHVLKTHAAICALERGDE